MMQQDCILQDHQENYAENLSYFTLQYIDFIFHKHSESIQLFYIRLKLFLYEPYLIIYMKRIIV